MTADCQQSDPAKTRWAGIAIILLASAVAVTPLLFRGPSCGSDFAFHFGLWHAAEAGWRQGLLYPHWMPSANHGAGEPVLLFYPPLTWMMGAALGSILPWIQVPGALSFLLLAGTGFGVRCLARQTLTESASILAGCAAIFLGHALCSIYFLSTFAAAAGGLWIPLLLLFALRDNASSVPGRARSLWARAFDTSAAPLAVAFAGAWLSNLPLGVMASYLLAAVAITSAVFEKSWAPLVRASAAVILGLCLAAFYLLPAAWEQRWVQIDRAINDPYMLVENNMLFSWHLNLWPIGSNAHPVQLNPWHHTLILRTSLVMFAMLGVAAIGVLVSLKMHKLSFRYPSRLRSWWIIMALIPLAVVFLNLPISVPVWYLLPRLKFLQFPYRWQVALEAPMAIFFAMAVWPSRRRLKVYVAAGSVIVFLAVTVFAGRYLFNQCETWHPDLREPHALERAISPGGLGVVGTREYASPPGAKNELIAIGLPDACLVSEPSVLLGKTAQGEEFPVWSPEQGSCVATFHFSSSLANNDPEHLHLTAIAPHPGYLVLRLRRYPAWRVTLNGHQLSDFPWRDDGLFAVPVPQGSIELALEWAPTPDVIAGRYLSVLAAFVLACIWILEQWFTRSAKIRSNFTAAKSSILAK